MNRLRHEITTAFGRLRTRRSYTWTAIAMLAVAIASNVAVFTVLSRTLLKPFPFDDDRMAIVYTTFVGPDGQLQEFQSGSVDFVNWQARSHSFESLGFARAFAGSISDRGETESIKVAGVSGGIFRMLKVRPFIGSDFTVADDRPESPAVMLAYPFWRRQFGGDRSVVGRSIVINGKPRRVAGVMAERFEIPNWKADAFVPAGFSLTNAPNPGGRSFVVFGRLKRGVPVPVAEADLQKISDDLGIQFPATHKGYGARVKPLREGLFGARRTALITLFVAVLLVHLLACANVANLMLAQISDQSTVTAVRLALGAPPGQIVRYRLIEGLIVSGVAAVGGAVAGGIAVRYILRSYADPQLIDAPGGAPWLIAAFVVVVTLLTAVAVAIFPALREARTPIAPLLSAGSQRSSATVGRRRARELFIVAEVALAIPLLVGAAMAVKKYRDLRTFDIGFKPDRIMTAQLVMPDSYDKPARARFVDQLARRLNNAPGVASAAVTTSLFKVNGGAATVARSEDMADYVTVNYRRITPRFFETMRSPLITGRIFNDGDVADSPAVAIVTNSLARLFWPGENPVGKKLVRKTAGAPMITVVGIAREIRDIGVAEDLGPTLYVPYLQNTGPFVSLVVRAEGDPASVRDVIKKAVQSLDPAFAPDEMVPLPQLVSETLGSYKLQVALMGGFAVIALILAATGVFAVTEYAVSRRMPEVGIRMAFGAAPREVVGELVRAAMRPILAGALFGIGLTSAAIRSAQYLSKDIPEVHLTNAASVIAILIASAIAASVIPALRARGARTADLLRSA